MVWQPIDTALRDGSILLLRQGRRMMSGFLKHYPQHNSWNWCVISRDNGDYSSAKGAGFDPTHWMPLPSPSVPGASGWQDIGPEQRDGKPILAGSVNHTCREVVCWQDDGEDGNEGWVNTGPVKDRFYPNPRWFTHWQPLPSPPAGEDKP